MQENERINQNAVLLNDLTERVLNMVEHLESKTQSFQSSSSMVEKMESSLRWANEACSLDPVIHFQVYPGLQAWVKRTIKRVFRKALTWYVTHFVRKQNASNSSVVNYMNTEFNFLLSLDARFRQLEAALEELKSEHKYLRESYAWLSLKPLRGDDCQVPDEAPEHPGAAVPFNYLDFENIFRGDEDTISQRQAKYLEFIPKGKVVDLGCGRGEFLRLLKENGYEAIGVEINNEMFQYCLSQGLNVIFADMFEYLAGTAEGSLAGVTLNQVVEHLTPAEIHRIITLAYSRLMRDGVLIMETQNPRSLAIFNGGFYIDPTHVKPVHPYTLDFICRSVGFTSVDVFYVSPIPEHMKFPHIKGSIDNLDDVNMAIDRLNATLYGEQDYVVVAKK